MRSISKRSIGWIFTIAASVCVSIVLLIVLSIAWIDKTERKEFERTLSEAQSPAAENIETELQQDKATTMNEQKPLPFNISVVYSPEYLVNLGGAERMHPFDIKKYEKIHNQLIDDGLLTAKATLKPDEVPVQDLLLIHSAQYLKELTDRKKVATYLEAPILVALPVSLDKGVLKPFRYATAGTILAARQALKHGIGVNIGGGYHHAKIDKGEGFCIYADVPIAIRKLQQEKLIRRAVIIDVDVHQGNGTIVCLEDDDSTFTFSMHQGDIYPIVKEIGDRDVELVAGMDDEKYIELLSRELPDVLDQAKADICFIVAGCDTLDGDPLAQLKMTNEGIVKRDSLIVKSCVKRKIPVVYTTSGGYSPAAWRAQYLSIKKLIETYSLAQGFKE